MHFTGSGYSQTEILQGYGLGKNYDFKYENDQLKVIRIDNDTGVSEEITLDENLKLVSGKQKGGGGCSGSLAATSALITLTTLAGAALIGTKKKFGGKKDEEK